MKLGRHSEGFLSRTGSLAQSPIDPSRVTMEGLPKPHGPFRVTALDWVEGVYDLYPKVYTTLPQVVMTYHLTNAPNDDKYLDVYLHILKALQFPPEGTLQAQYASMNVRAGLRQLLQAQDAILPEDLFSFIVGGVYVLK